jgi:hypothetical protein
MIMIWLITTTILWIIGFGCVYSLLVVAKRADELAEAMYESVIMRTKESAPYSGSGI